MESLQAQRVFTVREMNISEEMEGEQSLGCCEGWLVGMRKRRCLSVRVLVLLLQ